MANLISSLGAGSLGAGTPLFANVITNPFLDNDNVNGKKEATNNDKRVQDCIEEQKKAAKQAKMDLGWRIAFEDQSWWRWTGLGITAILEWGVISSALDKAKDISGKYKFRDINVSLKFAAIATIPSLPFVYKALANFFGRIKALNDQENAAIDKFCNNKCNQSEQLEELNKKTEN